MNGPPHPLDQTILRRFFYQLLGVSLLLTGGGLLWRGIDFAVAVLVGSLFIVANFLWTKRVVERLLLLDRKPQGLLTFTYLLKLGLTGFFLYLAIVKLAIDPFGIMIGVSSLVVTGFVAVGEWSLRGRGSS